MQISITMFDVPAETESTVPVQIFSSRECFSGPTTTACRISMAGTTSPTTTACRVSMVSPAVAALYRA